METTAFDIAVFGSDPLALLCAGLLADRHGRKVCLVSRPFATGLLPRGIDLSIAPATRPRLWRLARRLVPETRAVLEDLGAGAAVIPADPIVIGTQPATLEALQHMRHVALGAGAAVARVADADIGDGAVGYRFSAAVGLDRARLIPALLGWLETLGVHLTGPLASPATLRRDGSVRLTVENRMIVAALAVFLDADAMAMYLPEAFRDPTIQIDPGRGILTGPARPLPASIMLHIDRGATLIQGQDGSLTALMRGNPDSAISRLGACLPAQGPLRRAAQTALFFAHLADGAPLVGTVRGSRARIVAGLGPWGAFFAPAITRWIAGSEQAEDAESLASFGSQRGAARPALADFTPPRCLAGAA
ncbi:MAG: hypothetical protein ACO1OK_05560 [Devosia sp.]